MSKQYITTDTRDEDGCTVEGHAFPIDTDEEIVVARAAIRDAGLESAPVFAGDVDGLDGYANGSLLFAAPLYTAAEGRV